MKARWVAMASVVLGLLVAGVQAERPPQKRDDAKLVVVGTVKKITPKESKWFGDGISTTYTAEVAVDKVDRGRGAKAGETIQVTWYRVTKTPTKPPPAAYGHSYPIKAKDRARFWLTGEPRGKGAWTIIYNSNGVEKLTK